MNGAIKTFGKVSSVVAGLEICLAGLIILVISAFALFNHKEYEGKTVATISDIQKELIGFIPTDSDDSSDSDDQYKYTVFVDYEVDGKEYKKVQFDSYSSSMKIGDSIEIQYDLNDPSKIQGQNGSVFALVFMIIGGAGVVFGVFTTIKGFKSRQNNPMYRVMKS